MTQPNDEFPEGIADPGVESVLECRIEPASEYQLGHPITVKGTLHNSGSSAVWILSWNTFLDPKWQNCVSITHNGSPVPYVGISVLRLVPGRDSYIRIPAGESESREIDLSLNYAITEPGDYEISFRLPILAALDEGDPDPPADQRSLQLTLVESGKASFRINGVASTMMAEGKEEALGLGKAEALGFSLLARESALPVRPADTNCQGLNSWQVTEVTQAHRAAFGKILAALRSLEDQVERNNNLYKQYFDQSKWDPNNPDWSWRREYVKATLTMMVHWMSNPETLVEYRKQHPDPVCADGIIGHTLPGREEAIFLCEYFFNDVKMGLAYGSKAEWARASAVVHEISHAVRGTQDLGYSGSKCEELARTDPDLAVLNAENYAQYVMNVGNPATLSYAVRCLDGYTKNFLGWLQSEGHWLTLNGDDPDTPPKNKYVKVSWYEYEGKSYIKSSNSGRYIGDNGNDGKGNTQAAWNLWGLRTAVEWQRPNLLICIDGNTNQHLWVRRADKRVFWKSSSGDLSFAPLLCEFHDVT